MGSFQIKFRAWDKDQKIMYLPEYSEIRYMTVESLNEDNSLLEIMQYTGLKDKNGKEIYEGDICKWLDLESFNDEIIEDIFVVEWSDEFLKYIGVKEANYHDLYDYTDNTELKVIGNIYENPELLDIEED